jgi:hypothetical protein
MCRYIGYGMEIHRLQARPFIGFLKNISLDLLSLKINKGKHTIESLPHVIKINLHKCNGLGNKFILHNLRTNS